MLEYIADQLYLHKLIDKKSLYDSKFRTFQEKGKNTPWPNEEGLDIYEKWVGIPNNKEIKRISGDNWFVSKDSEQKSTSAITLRIPSYVVLNVMDNSIKLPIVYELLYIISQLHIRKIFTYETFCIFERSLKVVHGVGAFSCESQQKQLSDKSFYYDFNRTAGQSKRDQPQWFCGYTNKDVSNELTISVKVVNELFSYKFNYCYP